MDGKLVNIDGGDNRVAAKSFGPKRTIIAVGVNKIVKDLETAIWRIKNVAAPMNAKRFNRNSHCVTDSFCSECSPEDSICKAVLILEGRPSYADYHIVVVGESLGLLVQISEVIEYRIQLRDSSNFFVLIPSFSVD